MNTLLFAAAGLPDITPFLHVIQIIAALIGVAILIHAGVNLGRGGGVLTCIIEALGAFIVAMSPVIYSYLVSKAPPFDPNQLIRVMLDLPAFDAWAFVAHVQSLAC